MKVHWSDEDRGYQIVMTEHELGTLIYALGVAAFEMKDQNIERLKQEFLKLNDR